LKSYLAVAYKDLQIELRNRYSISTAFLFTLIASTIVNFSIPTESVSPSVYTGMLWAVMFFASMTGMSRAFVSEEEKGTTLLLKLLTSPLAVFYGKFIYNVAFSVLINFASALMFQIFFDKIEVSSYLFYLVVFSGSIGIASSSTIIGAIISRANVKGALFPILSLPILIPILMVGIEATTLSILGKNSTAILNDIALILAYSGLLVVVSSLVFEFVWRD
jgi:heme exporter protein B